MRMKTSDFLKVSACLLCAAGSWAYPTYDCSNKAADVVFVLDSSNSIWPLDFKKQTSFVRDVVGKFNVGPGPQQTRVGVVTFGHDVWRQFNLNEKMDAAELTAAVEGIRHGNGRLTNTGGAINFVLDHMLTPEAGRRTNVNTVMVVITDGRSQKWLQTQEAAKRAHAANLTVFAIGVGRNLDLVELSHIASDPDDEFLYMVDDFTALSSITNKLALKACEVSTPAPLTISTTDSPADQSHRECSGKPADVFFLIDSSGSISPKDFNKEISFVQNIVGHFDIRRDVTRVGIINFSHDAEMVVALNDSLNKAQLADEIADLVHSSGGTNTAEALKLVRQQGFAASVERPDVAKVVIVLTDGLSRDEQATAREARMVHARGINVYAVGIGQGVDMVEIRNIASDPSENYVFKVDDFNSLDTIKDQLASKTCTEKPSEIRRPNVTAVCTVQKAHDVMFVYDSTSMGVKTSNAISEFLTKVVSGLDMGSGNLRIGRLTDDCPSGGNMPLSDKLSPEDFSAFTLSSYSHMLRKLRRSGFTFEYGGRSDATKIAVLFIDADMVDLDVDVLKEAKELAKTATVYVVTLGSADIVKKISGDKDFRVHMHVNPGQSLNDYSGVFLNRLCEVFSPESVDYDIDYVVPV